MTDTSKPDFDIDQFKIDLGELLARYDVNLGVNLYGDTHNLDCEFYVHENRRGGKEFILNPNSTHIDSKNIVHYSRKD